MDPQYRQAIVDGAAANEARMVEEFVGQVVTNSEVIVSDIDSDGSVVLGLGAVKTYLDLPSEDVVKFEEGDLITVVGKIENISVWSSDDIDVELYPAYLVDVHGASMFKIN